MVTLNIIGQPSKTMAEFTEIPQLIDNIAGKFDLMLGLMQSHFDPQINIAEVTKKGYKGQLHQSVLPAYELSIRVDSSMEQVSKYLNDPQTSQGAMVGIQQQREECRRAEGVEYCPLRYNPLGQTIHLDAFAVGDLEQYLNFESYVVWLDFISYFKFTTEPEGSGVRVRETLITEIPAGLEPGMMDLMLYLTGLPKEMEKSLLAIKSDVERGKSE